MSQIVLVQVKFPNRLPVGQVKSQTKLLVSKFKSQTTLPVNSKIPSQIDLTQAFPADHTIELLQAINSPCDPNSNWIWDNADPKAWKSPMVNEHFTNVIKPTESNQSMLDTDIQHFRIIDALPKMSSTDPLNNFNKSAIFPDTSLQWPPKSQASNFIHHILSELVYHIEVSFWYALAFSAIQIERLFSSAKQKREGTISTIIQCLDKCDEKGSTLNHHAYEQLLKVSALTKSLVHRLMESNPIANPRKRIQSDMLLRA
mmetsp:Transcript_10622/g.22694  ORF Transcript_10622/g.22694 Transcript_10622/m.22694 type:complete len:258 (-) Transcript_10622:316-1089(-)